MKRVNVVLFLVAVVAAALLLAVRASAQTGPCLSGTSSYTIQKGDTVWVKVGPTWKSLEGSNPWLSSRTRVYDPDHIKVLIRPGETLCLPGGMAADDVVKNDAPVTLPKLGPTPPTDFPQADHRPSEAVTSSTISWWVWFLLGLVAFVIGWLFVRHEQKQRRDEAAHREAQAREHELTQNPVTSGPPIVEGGIPAGEPERLSTHFDDRARTAYLSRWPEADATRIVRVGPIEEGMISGEGIVGYADRARPRRIDPPQPGYRARFRFPDGSEHMLMALVACMNPCAYGEGMTGFTFVPGRIVVPAPVAPTTATPLAEPIPSTPVVPTAEPVPVEEAIREAGEAHRPSAPVVATSTKKFVSYAPVNSNGPAMLRWSGVNFHRFDIEADGTHVVRFTPIE